jgi:hypothetical protein
MAIEEITDVPIDLATAIGSFGLWLKALGLIVVGWILIQLINWLYNRKRIKKLELIQDQLNRIEKKISKLTK